MNTDVNIKKVPFNQIKVDDLNSRKKLKNIAELAESIKTDGLKSAMIVTNGGDEKHPYTLSAGYRRHAALKSLGWGSKDVPIIIVEDNAVSNLIENIQRDALHPIDAARRLWEMVHGKYPVPAGETPKEWDKKELAAKISKSVQHLSNLLRVHENVTAPVRKKLESRDVPGRFLFALAGMKPEEQEEAADAWIVEQDALEKAGRKKKPRQAKAKDDGDEKVGFVSPKKVVSTFAGVNYNLEDYVHMFTEKQKQVNKEEATRLQGCIDALEFILGSKRKFPGVVAADFELIAEEEEEEETEEETADEE